MYKADLHLHTTASDGSDTPAELVALAQKAGISVISITDHDTIAGSLEALKLTRDGIKIITGIEFSCNLGGEDGFDCHILGYGFDPESSELLAAIEHGRQLRLAKLEARLDYLKRTHGIVFGDEDIAYLRSLNSVARPHLAKILLKDGLVTSISEAFDKYLRGEGFPDDRIDAREAIAAIRAAGGIPVYAHSIGGEREKRLTPDEVEVRISELVGVGLMGLECYYSRYSDRDEQLLLSLAGRYGLLVSAGSDYHGKNKTVELGRLSSDGYIVPDDITVLSALADK